MKDRKESQRGAVLVPVMLMVMVMGILGAGALAISYRTYAMQHRLAGYQQAYYAAEASVQLTMDELRMGAEGAWATGAEGEGALLEAIRQAKAISPGFSYDVDQHTTVELEQATVRLYNGQTGIFVRIRGRYQNADRTAEGFMPYTNGGFGRVQVAERLQ